MNQVPRDMFLVEVPKLPSDELPVPDEVRKTQRFPFACKSLNY